MINQKTNKYLINKYISFTGYGLVIAATAISLPSFPVKSHAAGIISSLASTAAHSAAASAAGTGAAMATAHEMNKRQENADSVDSSPTSVCGKLLVTHSVAKQIAPLVGQSASHVVVQVSNESVDPDGTRQCTGTVTFPGGRRSVSWTAQKHGLLYKVEGSKNRWLMRLARDFRLLAI
ncbi:hypothetical protein [Komagataeibacter rhaeticus]|uniref:hypothetical protein n=1 Tax=Komagataeibacter rhaeticus TaxID=215221 RepID=UPI001A4667BA|nr:hypothetical protein [Komagataeibacter rhaeticus]MBL7241464.1 hypothetical protein [Komagataeibacter rhaeticus]